MRAFICGAPWGDVVFAGGEEIGGGFDCCKVYGGAVHCYAAGLCEEIVAVEFAKVKAVHRGGHVGGIVVPIE